MKRLLAAAAAAVLALTPLGCTKGTEGGNPGADAGFSLTAPPGDTNLKHGEEKNVTITIRRDSKFTADPITLKAEDPPGIEAKLSKTTAEASDKEISLSVKAKPDAALGRHVVKVTGTPKSGNPSVLEVKVEVVKP